MMGAIDLDRVFRDLNAGQRPVSMCTRRAGLLPPVADDAQELAEAAGALDDADRYVLMGVARAQEAGEE